MPPSARKRLCFFHCHTQGAPNLSKKEFEGKLEALIDELPSLPVAQTHLLKVEILLQNNLLDDYVIWDYAVGALRHICTAGWTLTFDNLPRPWRIWSQVKYLKHPDAQKIIEKGKKEFGMHIGARAFSVDVVPKSIPQEKRRCSSHGSQKFHALVDDFVALPIIQQKLVKYGMWLQNKSVDDIIQALDYAAASPIFVLRGECENWEKTLEMMKDPQAQKMLLDAGKDFSFTQGGSLFAMDVVTKICAASSIRILFDDPGTLIAIDRLHGAHCQTGRIDAAHGCSPDG
ncbi:hypothetical protein B0H13DRAFT_1867806 [Mycena leptocephala]|nr:hypothetical protein B0H13DRAFT_1867806 [Mycena leptocephala]